MDSMKKHLAIFSPEVIVQIFSGEKTIETRFSKRKIAPFGVVQIGDLVYIKPSGKDIVGQFMVKKVISFEGLDSNDWQVIIEKYGRQIVLGSKEDQAQFLKSKQDAKYGTLIFIDKIEQFITSPIKITKKDQRGWVVLE